MQHRFTLSLLDPGGAGPGVLVDVFDRYDLVLDLLRPGSPWTFSFWNSAEADPQAADARHATAWRTLMLNVRLGGQVVFAIDDAPQLNGVIETYEVHADRRGGAVLVISGRDLSAPALDWNADPRITLRGVALDECLQQLFDTVDLKTVVGYGADAERQVRTRGRPGARGARTSANTVSRRNRVDLSHARPGETVWQVADSIVKRLGYLMWVAPNTDGVNQMAVVIDTPNYTQDPMFAFARRLAPDGQTVTPDSNVLESRFSATLRGVPTVVFAAGRAPRGDQQAARYRVAYANNSLADFINLARLPPLANPLPSQPRWLDSARARSPATGVQEAARAMNDAMKEWRTYTALVQGHGQRVHGVMTLYAINTMARVYDRVGGFTLVDEEMLISRVEFMGSRSEGQQSRITMGTRGAIQLTPDGSVPGGPGSTAPGAGVPVQNF